MEILQLVPPCCTAIVWFTIPLVDITALKQMRKQLLSLPARPLPVGSTRNQAITVMYSYVRDCKLTRFILFMMVITKCRLTLILSQRQEILSNMLQIIVFNTKYLNSELPAY